MPLSTTDIANMALRHLGVTRVLADLDTDRSKEATQCRAWFEQARDECFRDFPWGFAKRTVVLALVEEEPNDEWAFSYRYPTDCMMLLRVPTGNRVETMASRVPFEMGSDDSGLLIFCDAEDASMQYTHRIDDTALWPADFAQAVSLYLAFLCAPALTAGDEFKLGARAMQAYTWRRATAQGNSQNEQARDPAADAEIISGR